MAILIPPGFSHNVVQFRQAGDPELMVCTFGVSLQDYPGDFRDVPDALFFRWQESILVSQTNTITLVGVTSYIGQDGAAPDVVDSTEAPVTGSGTQESLPSNCAMLIRKRTGVTSRRGRGRFYVPGVAEGTVDANGIVAPATLTAWQSRADVFLDGLATDGLDMVVLHNAEGVSVPIVPTPVSRLTVEDKIATQRKRMRP